MNFTDAQIDAAASAIHTVNRGNSGQSFSILVRSMAKAALEAAAAVAPPPMIVEAGAIEPDAAELMRAPRYIVNVPGLTLPDEPTLAIAEALSMPNFQCAPLAARFRCAGHTIKERSEDEQAFVLFWALKLAVKHGLEWRTYAGLELEAMAEGKKS